MCGDRIVAIISAILIAIRAPLIVRLFENNRDYLKIIATIFCAKCVRTVNENRTGFLYPIMQGGRSVLDKQWRLLWHQQWRLLWHQQWAIVGYAHSAHGYAISAQNITTFLKYLAIWNSRAYLGRDFSACGDTRKKIVAIQSALFSACGDTRKNSRDLNRDSNRAFLCVGTGLMTFFMHTPFL